MSGMNAGIILAGRQADPIGSFARGQAARAASEQYGQQNALRNLYQTQGQGILSGDQNALNALAQVDPGQALAFQGQHQIQNQRSATMEHQRAAAKRQAEQYAKSLSAEQAAAQAAQIEQGMTRAIGAYKAGDLNAVNQILQQAGEQPIQSLEQFPAVAAIYGDVLDTLKTVNEVTAGPKPADEYGRYVAEETAAGRTPMNRIDFKRSGQKTTKTQVGADGSVSIVEGFGGDSDPTDMSNVKSPAAMVASIDGILSDPALDRATGVFAPLQNVPGTSMRRFGARVDQLDGQAFLQAFESLKGGGQITEIEGQKATQAIGRLDSAQHADDYRQALIELKDILSDAMGRPPGWAQQQSAQPAEMPQVNDEAGYNALPSGTVFIAPDGTQRRKP